MKYSVEEIKSQLEQGKTLEQIGAYYHVTRQRMYQVISNLGISTPEKQRKNDHRNLGQKEKWVWKIIGHRIAGETKLNKMALFSDLELPDLCPVLGIPLDYSFGKGLRTDNSPSIDKIVPSKGYVPGNCIVISWRANRIKNDGTPEEHKKIADFYKNC
jgi:hypothetical protein